MDANSTIKSRSRAALYLGWMMLALLLALLSGRTPAAHADSISAATAAELAAAITTINAAGAGDHTINIIADITITSALPALNNPAATTITIEGANHTLTGDESNTVIQIATNTTVIIKALTITGGEGSSGPSSDGGGAIFNQGKLRLEGVSLSDNSATSGGAILNLAGSGASVSLKIIDSLIIDNRAGYGGGIASIANGGSISTTIQDSDLTDNVGTTLAGALYNAVLGGSSDLSLFNSSVSMNSSDGDAGAIFSGSAGGGSATVTIAGSEVHSNHANGRGGAIINQSEAASSKSVLILTTAALYANESGGNGGGIYNSSADGSVAQVYAKRSALHQNSTAGNGGAVFSTNNGGDVYISLQNSTISANEALTDGGGVYSVTKQGDAELDLRFVTLAANRAVTGGGLASVGSGGGNATAALRATIISGNSGGDCLAANSQITSFGYNLAGDNSCNLTHFTDLPQGNADLQPLSLNAPGQTKTQALGPASQAIDRVPFGVHDCGTAVNDDQRGVSRPQGIRCDIGAYEKEQPPLNCAPPLLAGDEKTFNQAILCANSAGAGQHTIRLTANVALNASAAMISNPDATRITLDGDGFTVNGQNRGTILSVSNDTVVSLTDITLTGGKGSSGLNGNVGGAIYNRGLLTITNSTITGNAAYSGAGIFNEGSRNKRAELTVNATTISNNQAANTGGGIASSGNEGDAVVEIVNGLVTGNSAVNYGGGIANSGFSGNTTVRVRATTLKDNSSEFGAGIFNNGNGGTATLQVEGSTLTGNTASFVGGAMLNNGNGGTATVELTNSTISGNNSQGTDGLANSGNGGTASMLLTFVTVAANGSGDGNALSVSSDGRTEVRSSIISAGQPGLACASNGGTIVSGGYNVVSDSSCGLNQTGDVANTDAKLLPLALNAPGTTQTHALSADSPALARVPNGVNGCGTTVTIDQRGATRPSPAPSCDVGAYELGSGVEPPPKLNLYLPMVVRN